MTEQNNAQEPQFSIQRIYIRDASFESPKAPAIFLKEWKPAVNLELNTRQNTIEEGVYEVILTVSATAKIDDDVAFIAEVQQAGIFMIKGLDADNISHMLGAFCPNLLFPYARETLDSLVVKGSFPALMLSPINFDALYAQELERMKQENITKN
ncbi:protein-export chaperone SecB [Gammaproteobacteria bacterium ESL0073]|uniref:Protein-export protein SecB n=1 Tax=Entomomonas moraniae TaxID=2213226 RepID=A0A3Q9JKG8_9GAMM|nr:protein-export chaperone SecB [Entomomonas moraniae]AWM81547.1 protein-export chaperone SecB [Gammaproteobacteria bacterium ESL0073]AZS51618.1 protein-export chaperone SecB [Entomomonas moraniae]